MTLDTRILDLLERGWRPGDWRAGIRCLASEDGTLLGVVVQVSDEHPGSLRVLTCFVGTEREPFIRQYRGDDAVPDLTDLPTVACVLAVLAKRVGLPESPVPYAWCRRLEDDGVTPAGWGLVRCDGQKHHYEFVGPAYMQMYAESDPLVALAMALAQTVEAKP